MRLEDSEDLARSAQITASSHLRLSSLKPGSETLQLKSAWGMMLPASAGRAPRVRLIADVACATELRAELRISSRPENHTPDTILASKQLTLAAGLGQSVDLEFDVLIDEPRYLFFCLAKNEDVSLRLSDQRLTGVLSLTHNGNIAVTASSTQTPPPDSGIDTFEFWTPQRRPGGKNFAITIEPPLDVFGVCNLTNGIGRPTRQPNAWVASFEDVNPSITLAWAQPKSISRIELVFDTDYDHPMESVLLGHPESVMPFCSAQFRVWDGTGRTLFKCSENYGSRRTITLDTPVVTDRLVIALAAPSPEVPASLFEVRCYDTPAVL